MERPPVLIYRLSHFFYKSRLRLVSKFIDYINRLLFSVWLPGSATIGKNFTVGYLGLGIVVHSNATIGRNCHISQNVTIGRNFGDKLVPVLSDFVYIGTGSVVFGEINIGTNVVIGSNSVINKSIEDNKIVVGSPFRIIGDTNGRSYTELDCNFEVR